MHVLQQLILAAPATTTKKTSSNGAANLILLAVFAVLIVLFLRSRKSAKRRTASLRSSIQVGQKVMTSSGIFATVVDSDDESFSLEVSDGVVMRFAKAAVTRVLAEPLNLQDTADEEPDATQDAAPNSANASSET